MPFAQANFKTFDFRKLQSKLFEIPHQHFRFFHSFFIPFPFENLSKMMQELFTDLD
jgi:hypothetical protein